jgi:hypothetical protein
MREAQIGSEAVEQFDEKLDGLPEGFRRTLLPARRLIAELLDLPQTSVTRPSSKPPAVRPTTREYVARAELIGTDTHVFAVVVRQRRRLLHVSEEPTERGATRTNRIVVHSFGPDLRSKDLHTLCKFLDETLAIELKPNFYESERLDELIAEGRTPPTMPSAEAIAASGVLSDKATRILAIAVKQSSGLLVGDLARQLPSEDRARTDDIKEALVTSSVVLPETVVICSKTGAQVAKVEDPSTLKEFAERGLKCACGNAITEEKIDTALSVSDLGRSLLDGSHWLTVLLIQYLTDLGVPLNRLLIDQVSEGDEMDCIVDISGEIALFELKDKEFSLGNAYSFGAKIGIIGPEFPVIFTTEHVGNDAKDHFSKPRRSSFRSQTLEADSDEHTVTYIQGIDNLRPGLMRLISQINLNDARIVLNQVLPFGTFSASVVLDSLSSRLIDADPSMTAADRPRSRRRSSRSATDSK